MMNESTLASSAFAVLGISPRAGESVINEAYDRLSFELGQDEAGLAAARARLLSSRDRVVEELRWLPELAPATAKEAMRAISSSDTLKLDQLRSGASGLARVNLGLELLRLAPDRADYAASILRDALAWSSAKTRQAIEEARSIASTRPLSPELWDQALHARQAEIASALGARFGSCAAHAALLASAASDEPDRREAAALLDAVVTAYGETVRPELSRLEAQIDEALATLRDDPERTSEVARLTDAIANWASLRRPVQRREASRGLEDAASARLFWSIRDLGLHLANKHNRYADVIAICEAMQSGFSDQRALAEKVDEDLTALRALHDEQIEEQALRPLVTACEEARNAPIAFSIEVLAGGLNNPRPGSTAANLVSGFQRARRTRLGRPAQPWLIVRDVAIKLHNEDDLSDAAATITAWLLGFDPPTELRTKLENDAETIRGCIVARDVGQAMSRNDLRRASDLLAKLPASAVGGGEKLEQLKAAVAKKRAARRNAFFWAGGFAALFIFSIINDGSDRRTEPSSSIDASSMIPTDNMTAVDQAMAADAALVADNADTAESDGAADVGASSMGMGEEEPPASRTGTLTRPQVRWCVFEDARLGYIQDRVPNSAADGFNRAAQRFNDRCYGANLYTSDRTAVQAELITERPRLQREAEARLSDWASSSRPPDRPASPTVEDVADPVPSPDATGWENVANGM